MMLERDICVQYQSIGGKKYIVKGYDAYELDEVGAMVWESLDGETTLERIAEIVAQKYNKDKSEVFEDIRQFANDLLSSGLVEEVK